MTQLTFSCFLERVKDTYPIEKISVNHFKWLEKANNYYKDNPQSPQTNNIIIHNFFISVMFYYFLYLW